MRNDKRINACIYDNGAYNGMQSQATLLVLTQSTVSNCRHQQQQQYTIIAYQGCPCPIPFKMDHDLQGCRSMQSVVSWQKWFLLFCVFSVCMIYRPYTAL